MPLKILIDGLIFDGYPHGGIARVYRELLPRVADRNPDFDIRVVYSSAVDLGLPPHPRLRGWRFRHYRPSRVFASVNQIRRRRFDNGLINWQPDIFQSTYYTKSPIRNLKTLTMVYDLIDQQYPFLMPNGPGFVSRQAEVTRQADEIVCISHATAERAIEKFGLDHNRTHVIHLDASPVFRSIEVESKAAFRKRYTCGKPFFLFVGSTTSYKNLGVVLRAFGRLRDKTDHWLVIAGHSLQHLEAHWFDVAISAGVEDRICRLVHPDDELLCKAYNAADAFVFPSLQEGFGIPLVEAMRCGAPVVASDIPVFREICGDAALFFDTHDPECLANGLLEVCRSEVRDRLVQLGFVRAGCFSWDKAAEQLGQIYRRLAN
ncbi:MAG: glycosyltransferase family 4 protein [Thiocapsa sp.]|uniref:glycosyltransferase family 4 protein n=1 Tax=Thiocapsa sp. TaxID=2024551 RepID=UPI001BCD61ED|nr:glycosyltransferase family 1 protein [Thiocapsa sp.]QVL50101.1 MAG: glycosyltransferase family 4 protein [Thiocapsa sp.]